MSTLLAAMALAVKTIVEHKLRALLTVLGVIIGTSTIIAVGSIIAGLDGSVSSVIQSFGSNTAIVYKFAPGMRFSLTPEELNRKPLTYQDAAAIAERCPSVERASAYLTKSFTDMQITITRYKGNELYQTELAGTQESYQNSGQAEIKDGRFFSRFEDLHRVPVAVIGEDVEKALFAGQEAIGKRMQVDGHEITVIGVMHRPAASMPGSNDNRVLLPYFTMLKMFPMARDNMLAIVAKPGQLPAAIDEARAVLRVTRHVPFNKPDNFGISTSEQMLEQFHSITAMVALVMVVLSSIGLLVGGIGVMNIMLVSVTERTREIGIRKAIGARRKDIVLQFLTEAVMLTGAGGLLGMLLGWTISTVTRLVFPSLPTAVPLWAAFLGFFVSIGVGLFFGIWPANKAARLDPVVALRYE